MTGHRVSSERAAAARCGGAPLPVQTARIRLVLVVFLLAFAVVSLRLAHLHLSPSMQLTEEERFHIGQVDLHQPRGNVVDRTGIILATDRKVPSIWVDPRRINDFQRVAMILSARLGLDENAIIEQISRRDQNGNLRKFVWLKRWLLDVSEEELETIIRSCGPAVQVRHEPLRYYPQGDTAAHLLGFVNRAGEASEGLELTFNEHLQSVPGRFTARKDSDRQLLESLTLEYHEAQGGETVYLTLDTDIQHTLEHALDTRMIECEAQRAMGIVMDPHTGAILALATRPSFDPNFYDTCEAELRKNRAMLDMFEPGSAFKIVTASAALELGLVTPDTMINCEGGAFNPYGHRISDFHRLYTEPFLKCFEESSNIAIIKVGAMLGPERLEQWIRRFGFGQVTSRDFQFESPGRFRSVDKWSRLSMGSLPMGQEIAVTMTQLARAFAVIANGGYLVEPHFVERAVSRSGELTYERGTQPRERILSPETALTMQRLCHQVVTHGTGKPASIPEYRVGGKTGTAQIARTDGRGYAPGRYTTIFAGFAPVTNPRLVSVIVVQEPMIRLHYGGYVCGPVFRDVVRDALIRMDVPKDATPEDTLLAQTGAEPESAVEDVIGDAIEEPLLADAFGKAVETTASVPIKVAAPPPPERLPVELLDSLELVARTGDQGGDGNTLPDLIGLTKRQAMDLLTSLGVPWDPRGAGWVVAQDPPAGTPLQDVTLCSLELANRRTESVKAEAAEPKKTDDPKRTL
jgi:cell division protein FtsI/penicillin-binding protein 2